MLVQVEDGRAVKLPGDPKHAVTRGFLCGKVARYLEREYSPERLLYPQSGSGRRAPGRFERIGWDEALDTIAERLKAVAREFGAGGDSALQLRGHHGPAEQRPGWTGGSFTGWARRVWTGPFVPRPAVRR